MENIEIKQSPPFDQEIEDALNNLLADDDEHAIQVFKNALMKHPATKNTIHSVTPIEINIKLTPLNSPKDQFYLDFNTLEDKIRRELVSPNNI